jgi:hypothetical protein
VNRKAALLIEHADVAGRQAGRVLGIAAHQADAEFLTMEKKARGWWTVRFEPGQRFIGAENHDCSELLRPVLGKLAEQNHQRS